MPRRCKPTCAAAPNRALSRRPSAPPATVLSPTPSASGYRAGLVDAWRRDPWQPAADGDDAGDDDYTQPAASVRDAEARREAAYLERNQRLADAWRSPASGARSGKTAASWVR
jgi:hypothetical protein